YAGLTIDTTKKELPGAYLGITTRERNDSLFVTTVDWESAAWNAGVRPRQVLLEIDGAHATSKLLKEKMDNAKVQEKINLTVLSNNTPQKMECAFGTKKQKTFAISQIPNPSQLQKNIYEHWMHSYPL